MYGSSASAAPKVVLIVEDEEPIAQALAYVIEELGYTPIIALHGRDALEQMTAYHPDLIITDLMMPQMSGKDLIAALRAVENTVPPPVVLMTAAGPRYAEEAGADAVLAKPFELSDVEALLERFLGGT